jgi:starch phosphorylase
MRVLEVITCLRKWITIQKFPYLFKQEWSLPPPMQAGLERIKEEYFSHVPERIQGLVDLSYNLWWSWTPEAKMIFKQISPHAWIENIHNPVRMLRDLPVELLEKAATRPQYLRHYDIVMERFHREMKRTNHWFEEQVEHIPSLPVAYFSMEYGLHHSLPFYAGGLGFLAGDHLKECSDLGIPMVAVGFMYGEGYLHQHIQANGWQEDVEEHLDRDASPVMRVMDGDQQLVVKVPLIQPALHVAVWKVDVGRVPLYLMDTAIEGNISEYCPISSRLYTQDLEWRLCQEVVLGFGGREVLRCLGIEHSILHLNEGHTAFAALERVGTLIKEGLSNEESLEQVRNTSIFTTHTPLESGHDRFPFGLMDPIFREYWESIGLDRSTFLRLGYHPADLENTFNMTALGMRLSGYRNAVSGEHGVVARRMWKSLWPDLPEEEIPIHSITNGVHVPTWLASKMVLLLDAYLGRFYPEWWEHLDSPDLWRMVEEIPDRELWQAHQSMKRQLFNRIREYKRWNWAEGEAEPINLVAGGTLLDPNALTIAFARRFTAYKRPELIFSDVERLKKIVNNRWRPVQIIFAGKAHPADTEGKKILQRVYEFAQRRDFGGRIAFVQDYGEQVAQYMVHGVDLWLNTPVSRMEACGTSGMKASMNGVIQMSVPTGWWVEGYNGNNGWVIGGENEEEESRRIYELLEQEIVPLYYTVSEDGTPHQWIQKMKEAIKSISSRFSAKRMSK